MGRTKRKRKRRMIDFCKSESYSTLELQKWLAQNNWKNETKLKIKNFPITGRGVMSYKAIEKNDILITMPYDLLITFTTIQAYFLKNKLTLTEKLTMQDLLALFLLIERNKENSPWKVYINSLPAESPSLPWLAPREEINLFPTDLQIASEKCLENFKNGYERVKKSIGQLTGCVLNENLFTWAYVLVNTRAVYVDPNLVPNDSSFQDFLIDEPTLALCPFLDMFNHHFLANTEAKLIDKDNALIYTLKTLTSFKKFEQIMISYGPHNNEKLLMHYGFFIPGNTYDTVEYKLEEIIKILKLNFDNKKYKFITEHTFEQNLHISYDGASFNLKAVLYINLCENLKGLSSIIFNDSYPEEFLRVLSGMTNTLLEYKRDVFVNDCDAYVNKNIVSDYLKYKLDFVRDLLNKVS